LAQETPCREGHSTGPCEYCHATVATTNPHVLRLEYEVHLNQLIPPQATDFSITINAVATTITNAIFVDQRTIDVTFDTAVHMDDAVVWSYIQNSADPSTRLESTAQNAQCNSKINLVVTNQVQSPMPNAAFVYDLTPNTIELQWSLNLNQTSVLNPNAFYIEIRRPPNDQMFKHTVARAQYFQLNAVQLVFSGEPVIYNTDVVSVVYTGHCIQSTQGIFALPIQTTGRLHEGFEVLNHVLSPNMGFTAQASCRPWKRRSQIVLDMSSSYASMTIDVANATAQDFLVLKIQTSNSQIVSTFQPTSVEVNPNGGGHPVYLSLSTPVGSNELGFEYRVQYTRPLRTSTRQFIQETTSTVLGNVSVTVNNLIESTKPVLKTAAMVLDVHEKQVLRLEFSEPFNHDRESPHYSQVDDAAWMLFYNEHANGKMTRARHAEYCQYPETCFMLYLKDDVDYHENDLYLKFQPNPAHPTEGMYDMCGNEMDPWPSEMRKVTNLLPPPRPTTPSSTTTTSTTTAATPTVHSPSPSFVGSSTSTTTTAPDPSATAPSGQHNNQGNVPSTSGTPGGTPGGTKDVTTPSSTPRHNSSYILYVTGGSIIGLIVGCGCLYFCFPCSSDKSGRRKKNRRRGGGGGRNGSGGGGGRLGGSRRFRDEKNNRPKNAGGKFESFQDEFSDEDDENMLQLGPLSTGVLGENDEEHFTDDFDTF
jgi:uncharacterized membrane protein YgcG